MKNWLKIKQRYNNTLILDSFSTREKFKIFVLFIRFSCAVVYKYNLHVSSHEQYKCVCASCWNLVKNMLKIAW